MSNLQIQYFKVLSVSLGARENPNIFYLNVLSGRIDGNWSRWTLYTQCTKTCGGGTQHRTRTCTNPPFANGGKKCQGDSVEVLACGTVPCPGRLIFL